MKTRHLLFAIIMATIASTSFAAPNCNVNTGATIESCLLTADADLIALAHIGIFKSCTVLDPVKETGYGAGGYSYTKYIYRVGYLNEKNEWVYQSCDGGWSSSGNSWGQGCHDGKFEGPTLRLFIQNGLCGLKSAPYKTKGKSHN